jgi:phospholipid/cholesterol/gamma-HCH transport system ATP-binding protein
MKRDTKLIEIIGDGGLSFKGRPVLECRNLRASHGSEVLFEDLTIEIMGGEVVALIVESEWCSRVIPRIAIGVERPDEGEVFVLGTSLDNLNERHRLALRHLVGYLFHNSGLIHNLTVWYNVALPALYHSRFTDVEGVTERVEPLIDFCNIRPVAQLRPALLDEETRKRVGLARAWVLNPPLVVMEDPLMDIDSSSAGELLDLAFGPAPGGESAHDPRPGAPGVLITSQGLHESLFRYVDRLIIIDQGRVVFNENPRGFDRRGMHSPADILGKNEAS